MLRLHAPNQLPERVQGSSVKNSSGKVCALLLFAASGIALAQDKESLPELVTDRPDFTEATEVVGAGVAQVEVGFTLDREGAFRHLSGPELLLRSGISKRLEFRFGGDGFLAQAGDGEKWQKGHSDTELGLKISIWKQRHYLPAFSIIPMISTPTGSHLFSSGSYDPTLKLAFSGDLPHGFSLGGNVNFSSLDSESGRTLQKAFSASLGHSIGAGFDAYWEIYGFSPWDETGAAWIANTGIARGVGTNAQWDLRVGKKITEAGPDWFVGAGFAFRRHRFGGQLR